MKKIFLRLFLGGFTATGLILSTGCDLNPLGGDKSKIGADFEPGKHISSQPPTISAIQDYIMDENDSQTIPFTIHDPDTFMVCSFVFVKATSTNGTLVDPTGLSIGGTYPNCNLKITPKAYQYGISNVTLDLYDFWTHATTTFKLTVAHILTPGLFMLVDAEGDDQQVTLTWQNAAYMQTTGAYTSAYYTVYYRPNNGVSSWSSVPRVRAPYVVTGLANGVEYEFYIKARNSIGQRDSNHLFATPTRFKLRGHEFISGSTQYENTPGTNTTVKTVNTTLVGFVDEVDVNYPSLNYSASENPVNGNFPAGTPKGSSITTPSGRYKVYTDSQGVILSGAQQ